MNPVIAVSIVSFGAADLTESCVWSLLADADSSAAKPEIVVFLIDNGSPEKQQDILRAAFQQEPRVVTSLATRNRGFSAGHNANLQRIFSQTQPNFVWLLNNDCIIQTGCIDALLKCATNSPHTALWGATLLERDGETVQCAGGCHYNAWLSSYRQIGHKERLQNIERIDTSNMSYVAGASMFFSTKQLLNAFKPLRGQPTESVLNETFFLYFEELDLAERMAPGFEMNWCRHALIVHLGGKTTEAHNGKRSALAEYHATLSALKFTQIYYPRRLWFTAPARFAAKCMQLLAENNFALMAHVFRAYRDFFRTRRGRLRTDRS